MNRNEITLRSNIPDNIKSQVDYILLDGSGSMLDKWHPTLRSIDGYLQVLRADHVDSYTIVDVFSEAPYLGQIQRNGHVREIPDTTQHPSVTSNYAGTALYDAINLAVRALAKMNPVRAALSIYTDGEECSSKYTSLEQARKLLAWCRGRGWCVTFIGCDFDNQGSASLLGANKSEYIGVAQARLADATRELAKKRTQYARTGAPMHWSAEEQQRFGGYLAHHGGK